MENEWRIRLLLSSRNPTLREGIKKVVQDEPSIRIVGEVAGARQTVRETMRLNPDFVLMDIDAAGPATLNAIRQIRKSHDNVQLWVCSLWEDENLLASCLKAGATGSVPGSAKSAELIRMFRPKRHTVPRYVAQRYQRTGKSKVALWLILLIGACASFTSAQEAQSPRTQEQRQSDYSQVQQQAEQSQTESDAQPQQEVEETPEVVPEEEEPIRPPRNFYFSAPFTASAVRENRLPFGDTTIFDWATVIAVPEMTLANEAATTDFYVSYQPEYELFNRHKEFNAWSHTASLRLSHQINPKWTFGLRNSFLRTEDPTRKLRESIFLLPRSRFTENVLSLSADYWRDSRTKYSLSFDNSVSSLFLPNLPLLPDLPNLRTRIQRERFDQLAGALTFSVARSIAPRQRLIPSYSFIIFRDLNPADDPSGLADASWRGAHNASLTYERGQEQRGPYLELSGGVLHGGGTSYNALSRIGYNWDSFSLYATYSRQLAFIRGLRGRPGSDTLLTSGLLPETVSQALALDLAGTVSRHLVIDLGASAGKGGAVFPGQKDPKSFTGRARFAYRIGRVFPFVGAEFYVQSFNSLTQSRLERSRLFAGFSVLLTPVAEAETAPIGDVHGRWPIGTPGLTPRRNPRPRRGEQR